MSGDWPHESQDTQWLEYPYNDILELSIPPTSPTSYPSYSAEDLSARGPLFSDRSESDFSLSKPDSIFQPSRHDVGKDVSAPPPNQGRGGIQPNTKQQLQMIANSESLSTRKRPQLRQSGSGTSQNSVETNRDTRDPPPMQNYPYPADNTPKSAPSTQNNNKPQTNTGENPTTSKTTFRVPNSLSSRFAAHNTNITHFHPYSPNPGTHRKNSSQFLARGSAPRSSVPNIQHSHMGNTNLPPQPTAAPGYRPPTNMPYGYPSSGQNPPQNPGSQPSVPNVNPSVIPSNLPNPNTAPLMNNPPILSAVPQNTQQGPPSNLSAHGPPVNMPPNPNNIGGNPNANVSPQALNGNGINPSVGNPIGNLPTGAPPGHMNGAVNGMNMSLAGNGNHIQPMNPSVNGSVPPGAGMPPNSVDYKYPRRNSLVPPPDQVPVPVLRTPNYHQNQQSSYMPNTHAFQTIYSRSQNSLFQQNSGSNYKSRYLSIQAPLYMSPFYNVIIQQLEYSAYPTGNQNPN